MKLKSIFSSSSNGSLLTVNILIDEKLSKNIVKKWELSRPNGDKIYCRMYSDNHFDYGLIQGDYESFGHTKGYVWSSRASVMNKLFGLELIDVTVYTNSDQWGLAGIAYPVRLIEPLLPKGFKIVKREDVSDTWFNIVSDEPINKVGTIWGDNCDNPDYHRVAFINK